MAVGVFLSSQANHKKTVLSEASVVVLILSLGAMFVCVLPSLLSLFL